METLVFAVNESDACEQPWRVDRRACILMVGNFLSSRQGNFAVYEELAEQLTASGWPIIPVSTKTNRLVRLFDMIATVWQKRNAYRVAQVNVYSGLAFFWAEVVCGFLNFFEKPFILTLHGGKLPEFAARWPRRVRHLMRSAAVVTTPSGYLLDKMKSLYPGLQLLPNALDLNKYYFKPRLKPRPRLIWLRAFHNIYNPQLAPHVLASLVNTFPDMRLFMFGPDKGDGSLQNTKQVAMDLNVTEQLEINGRIHKTEVPICMNTCDVFLNTTFADNTPISVLEAMACGLCVVSTNVGGIPYLLEHEKDALLVPPNNSQVMAAAVHRILTEPVLAERLSRNARKKAEQFDWAAILPQWEALLRKTAGC
jgi:glycosyltransferase involved in cell wall biosynthesis